MLIEYYPLNTTLHKLDVRTKLTGFIVLTVIAFIFLSPVINLILALLCWITMIAVKVPLKRLNSIIKPLIPIFIIMLVITGFSYPPASFESDFNKEILFYLIPGSNVPFTVGGIFLGITLVLRILTMVFASTIVTFTTPIEDILQLFKKMKMPYQLAFVITTGLRFIPTMQKKAEMIQEAQIARGAEIGSGGMIKKIKSFIPILIPIIVNSLRMSDNLAVAMLNRGFGAMKTSTDIDEIKMTLKDYLIISLLIIIFAAALWAHNQNFGAL